LTIKKLSYNKLTLINNFKLMEKIKLELDAKYGEYIQLIKELILTED
jgi:hypothetical protein